MPKSPSLNVFYMSPNPYGGWVTYTSHLIYGLRGIGVNCNLFKIGNRTESNQRDFGYELKYRNISLSDAVAMTKDELSLVTAVQKNFKDKYEAIQSNNLFTVVHDPTEFKNINTDEERCITIRKTVHGALPRSQFIGHPYVRKYSDRGKDPKDRKVHATSICRIDFDKHTEILLDANRLLPQEKKIQIRGFENRLYTKFKILPKYPEWTQSVAQYERTKDCAVNLCRESVYTCDMSLIVGDGGGTQYSFLEAMDAGSINVLHSGWIIPGDEMDPPNNCHCVDDGETLSRLLQNLPTAFEFKLINDQAEEVLDNHEANKIALQLFSFLLESR